VRAEPQAIDPRREAAAPQAGAASLGASALRGSFWTLIGFGAGNALRMVSNLLLSRLLFPEAFGAMALLIALISGLEMFSDVGLRPGVVASRRGDEPAFLRTAWTLQVVRGGAIWLAACAVSPAVARFYGEPFLSELLPVAALVSLIGGLDSISLLRLERNLSLGRVTGIELTAQVVSLVLTVVWALVNPTVWVLIGGLLAGRFVRMLLSHRVDRARRDRFGWDPSALRELMRFGGWIFASTVLAFFAGQADRLIFGKTIPMAQLGVYSIALMIAGLPSELANRLGGSVMFPALTRRRDAGPGLEEAFLRARLPLLAATGFLVSGLIATGQPLIDVLYDARYAEAGWILQFLAAAAWFQALGVPSGAVLLALSQPRWLAFGNAAKVAGIVALIPAGFALAGFPGAVVGYVCAELLRYAAVATGAQRAGFGRLAGDLGFTAWVAAVGACGAAASSAHVLAGPSAVARVAVGGAVVTLLWAPGAWHWARAHRANAAAART
jgi:O-antigen/teichoic acid export membrane protein